jgi:hypothetical protein
MIACSRRQVRHLRSKRQKEGCSKWEVQGIKGDLFHFKKIKEGVCKVVVWHMTDGSIELFAPNEDDYLPQFFLKDVEGTTTLWEEENFLAS